MGVGGEAQQLSSGSGVINRGVRASSSSSSYEKNGRKPTWRGGGGAVGCCCWVTRNIPVSKLRVVIHERGARLDSMTNIALLAGLTLQTNG